MTRPVNAIDVTCEQQPGLGDPTWCAIHGTYHPRAVDEVDLSAAAATLLVEVTAETSTEVALAAFGRGRAQGMTRLWEQLTGLHGEAALDFARTIADRDDPTIAHLPPF